MTYGTSHFVSKAAAIRYYRDYEGSDAKQVVEQKIREGQIHIGRPHLKPGETLSVVDGGKRYAISNPRKVRGRSTTLRNMASVTIRKLPNGVVKITGRKMAGKRNYSAAQRKKVLKRRAEKRFYSKRKMGKR